MSTNANDVQHGGNHYKKAGALQHWDIVALFNLDYFLGNSTKYQFRWQDKGGILDLKKSIHYVQKKIEIEEARAAGTLTEDILTRALQSCSKVDAAESSDEVAALTREVLWDGKERRGNSDKPHPDPKIENYLGPTPQSKYSDAFSKCALCGELYPRHTDTCTRRTKPISQWCSRCNTLDGHKADCPESKGLPAGTQITQS